MGFQVIGGGGLPSDVTKGGLIGADGSDWAVIPVGTDTHVLTANSALDGGWGWAAASAGGRVTSWKTVGGDASDDYATISAALSDTEYSLIVTSSITESVGVAALADVDVNVIFESPSFTWTFNDGIQIISASYESRFNVFLNGATITWGNTTSVSPFDFSGNQNTFNLFGGGFLTNTSTVATTPLVEYVCSQGYYGKYDITAANVATGGIYGTRYFYAEHLKFTGGGTSCYWALNVIAPDTCSIGVLEFTGAFSQSSSSPCYALNNRCPVDYIYFNMSDGTEPIEIWGEVGVIRQQNTNTLNFNAGANVRQGYQASGSAAVNIDAIYDRNISYKDTTSTGALNWAISPTKYIYEVLSTTDATQTEIDVHDGQRLAPASNWTAHCDIKVLSMRDNQDWAVFQMLNVVIANDGGVYTITNGATGGTPDQSKGTGSTLTLDVDASSGLRIRITANASENWDHKAEVNFVIQNN